MKILTKIIFGAALAVGSLAIGDEMFNKKYPISGIYSRYNLDDNGGASITINNKAYDTSIDEKTLKLLRPGETYTFTAKDPIFSSPRILEINNPAENTI